MDLQFNVKLAENYNSNSQKIRVLSADWVLNNSYCPCCGNSNLNTYKRNNPAADFYCNFCKSDYELKSFKILPKLKMVDGAYSSMIGKIRTNKNPNFFLLQYNPNFSVINYFTIPRHYFTLNIIEKRKPLSKNARRADWVGCNVLFGNLPKSSFIHIVKNGIITSPSIVIKEWQKTSFLLQRKIENRGWLIELINIVDRISSKVFTIQEVYKFEESLKQKYPSNKFVREKIRQQLQVLRDKGLIKFLGKGSYQKVGL